MGTIILGYFFRERWITTKKQFISIACALLLTGCGAVDSSVAEESRVLSCEGDLTVDSGEYAAMDAVLTEICSGKTPVYTQSGEALVLHKDALFYTDPIPVYEVSSDKDGNTAVTPGKHMFFVIDTEADDAVLDIYADPVTEEVQFSSIAGGLWGDVYRNGGTYAVAIYDSIPIYISGGNILNKNTSMLGAANARYDVTEQSLEPKTRALTTPLDQLPGNRIAGLDTSVTLDSLEVSEEQVTEDVAAMSKLLPTKDSVAALVEEYPEALEGYKLHSDAYWFTEPQFGYELYAGEDGKYNARLSADRIYYLIDAEDGRIVWYCRMGEGDPELIPLVAGTAGEPDPEEPYLEGPWIDGTPVYEAGSENEVRFRLMTDVTLEDGIKLEVGGHELTPRYKAVTKKK